MTQLPQRRGHCHICRRDDSSHCDIALAITGKLDNHTTPALNKHARDHAFWWLLADQNPARAADTCKTVVAEVAHSIDIAVLTVAAGPAANRSRAALAALADANDTIADRLRVALDRSDRERLAVDIRRLSPSWARNGIERVKVAAPRPIRQWRGMAAIRAAITTEPVEQETTMNGELLPADMFNGPNSGWANLTSAASWLLGLNMASIDDAEREQAGIVLRNLQATPAGRQALADAATCNPRFLTNLARLSRDAATSALTVAGARLATDAATNPDVAEAARSTDSAIRVDAHLYGAVGDLGRAGRVLPAEVESGPSAFTDEYIRKRMQVLADEVARRRDAGIVSD